MWDHGRHTQSPWIRESRIEARENEGRDSFVHKSPQPHWDTLIIDECSKTTFNEFIVPAMYCRRFILVGDIRQLPPYTQEDEFKSNLENIKGFGFAEQRALLLNYQLAYIKKPGVNDPRYFLLSVQMWFENSSKNGHTVNKIHFHESI